MTVIRTRAGRSRVFDGRPHLLSTELTLDVGTKNGLYTYIEGVALPFNVFTHRLGMYQVQFLSGSVNKTIAENGHQLPLLLFHNSQDFPVGNAVEWDLSDNQLAGRWEIDSSPRAQEAARHADEKRLTGLSVYATSLLSDWEYTAYEDWNPADMSTWDRCSVIEARLDEVSLTPTPAFQQARVSMAFDSPRFGYVHNRHAVTSTNTGDVRSWLDSITN